MPTAHLGPRVLQNGAFQPPVDVKVAPANGAFKANPRQASFTTTGAGATPHFVGVMLARSAGIDLTAIHYKGGAPALQDLLGGQIPMAVNPTSEVLPYIRAGKIRDSPMFIPSTRLRGSLTCCFSPSPPCSPHFCRRTLWER